MITINTQSTGTIIINRGCLTPTERYEYNRLTEILSACGYRFDGGDLLLFENYEFVDLLKRRRHLHLKMRGRAP